MDIQGPGGAASFVTDPLKVRPSTEAWVEVIVPIIESEWQVTSGNWQDLITDVSLLDIEIELVFNGNPLSQANDRDQDAIDNVRLVSVPVPSTLMLLALTPLLLINHLRRRSRT